MFLSFFIVNFYFVSYFLKRIGGFWNNAPFNPIKSPKSALKNYRLCLV
ncbi:hypothetical protein HPNQ4053_0251 [Helicobacter pylori NQ4053]|uniref:Uncharacterized protein n=1 Tax=Helicobacter pylori NQ4053 TaxID=992027 RepID=J0JBI9_HELPX|nr:hypothetical protein HPNQ4053_0251 [Helicobacter pylori NQ4053]